MSYQERILKDLIKRMAKAPKQQKFKCCRCDVKTKDYNINGYYVCKNCMIRVFRNKDIYFSPYECVFCNSRIVEKDRYIVYKGIFVCEKCLKEFKMITL